MRLTYTADPPKFSDPIEQTFLEKLIEGRKKVGLGLDPIYRTLLISPPFAQGFTQFFSAIRYNSSIPDDLRELAICRVGAINGAAYEWYHHMPLLMKAGLSDEAVETVRTARPGHLGTDGEGGLNLRLWIVMQYVDAMTKDIQVGDDIFNALKQEICDERQILELTLTIAGYNAVSRFLIALDVGERKGVNVMAQTSK